MQDDDEEEELEEEDLDDDEEGEDEGGEEGEVSRHFGQPYAALQHLTSSQAKLSR